MPIEILLALSTHRLSSWNGLSSLTLYLVVNLIFHFEIFNFNLLNNETKIGDLVLVKRGVLKVVLVCGFAHCSGS